MDRHDMQDTEFDTIARLVSEGAESISERSRRDVRGRVMSTVTRDAFVMRARRMFGRAVATTTVAATLVGGVSYAAAISLPGDALYPLKRVSEDVTLQVLPDGALQQRFLFIVATRRADELARMAQGEVDDALMSQTLEQFRLTTNEAFRGVGQADEPTASETRLREHVESVPEPQKAQLQEALDDAGTDTGTSQEPMGGATTPGSGEGDGPASSSDPMNGPGTGPSDDTTPAPGPGRP